MYGQANCYADVRRGDEENSDGDTVQAGLRGSIVYHRKPFSILEVRKLQSLPSGLEPRIIRYPNGRCDGNIEIQEDDQIYDLTHQRLYTVTAATRGDSAVAAGEWVLQLQRITGGAQTP
jgi:hypothetical protein